MRLPPWPVFEDDETRAVQQVLASGRVNYWTGDQCRAFEAAWDAYHPGVRSMAMANGSLTMDAALRVLGIGAGDEVIVAPRTYVASAMCVALAGATPVFADINPDSGCITPATAEAVRTPRTKAIIPVHIGGWPCDMPAFTHWAQQHRIHIIEDCAQAHGARIGDRPVGTWGTFASWSFCQDKLMTTGGEGGMLATPDVALWKQVWALAQHGKDHDRCHEQPTGPASNNPHFRWLVDHAGTNLRMTEMQASIGIRQLAKLDRWVAARARNSAIMRDALRTIPSLRVPEPPAGHAHYRCVVFVQGGAPRRPSSATVHWPHSTLRNFRPSTEVARRCTGRVSSQAAATPHPRRSPTPSDWARLPSRSSCTTRSMSARCATTPAPFSTRSADRPITNLPAGAFSRALCASRGPIAPMIW